MAPRETAGPRRPHLRWRPCPGLSICHSWMTATIVFGRPIAVVMMSAMIAMMFERDIVIPSSGPFWLPPEGTHLVVLGGFPPDTHNSTPMCSSVKWFWVDFLGFLSPPIFGAPPLFLLLRLCSCLWLCPWLLILGVSGCCWRPWCALIVGLTCGYCIKGLQSVSNFVIIKV